MYVYWCLPQCTRVYICLPEFNDVSTCYLCLPTGVKKWPFCKSAFLLLLPPFCNLKISKWAFLRGFFIWQLKKLDCTGKDHNFEKANHTKQHCCTLVVGRCTDAVTDSRLWMQRTNDCQCEHWPDLHSLYLSLSKIKHK